MPQTPWWDLTGMNAESEQQIEFQSRLQRISQRATSQTLFVGSDEVYQLARRERSAKRRGPLAKAFYPVLVLLALALGALGHAGGMLARFHICGLTGWSERPDLDMLVQLAVGFAVAMVLGCLIGLRLTRQMLVKLAGSGMGVLFFHNAVHLYPAVFGKLTSAMWVSQVIGTTKAQSLLWMGISFPF